MKTATVSGEAGLRTDFRASVVIVSPDEEGGRQVRTCLDAVGGFEATMVRYGGAGIADFQGMQPGVILLAILKDPAYGLATCRQLRLSCDLPIVICSCNDSERDIVRAFESGADDYLVMPMRPTELGARLRAVLRRSADWPSAQPAQPVLVAGEFEIRLNEQRVFQRGKPVDLSPMEFRLLASLMRRPGQLVSHSVLLAEVWGPQYVDSRNYLRLYVQYLREKIEHDPHHPKCVINEWGVGYRFEPGGSSSALPHEASRAVA
jgi:two-component system KDP operon response regulator KdpE